MDSGPIRRLCDRRAASLGSRPLISLGLLLFRQSLPPPRGEIQATCLKLLHGSLAVSV